MRRPGPRRPARERARLGLQMRVAVLFAGGALATSAVATGGTYLATRTMLVEQREQLALQQALASAQYVNARNPETRTGLGFLLNEVPTSRDNDRLISDGSTWYSATAPSPGAKVPDTLARQAEHGSVAFQWASSGGTPSIVVAVPLPERPMVYYEISPAEDLERTLDALRTTLTAMALLATLIGAAGGWLAARYTLRPLRAVAAAGARIGAGEFGTRLPPQSDRDLTALTGAFNSMADQVQRRIERDARFAAEVGHELRSPLMTLMTAVGLLRAHRDEVPEDARLAIDLADTEVHRFGHTLEDLLRLGALDGDQPLSLEPVSATEVARGVLAATHRPAELLRRGSSDDIVLADKEILSRALSNLLDNAENHGGGITAVRVQVVDDLVRIIVDDSGPGVPEDMREAVFGRFVRGGARGSKKGTGLGLSIVAETARAHHGTARVGEREGGGAAFVIELPRAKEVAE